MSLPVLRRRLLPLLFPQEAVCHLCDRALDRSGSCLCPACLSALRTLRLPREQMLTLHQPLLSCMSAYRYEGEARQLCHLLKYRGDAAAARPLGEGMAEALALSGLTQTLDMVLPVPLHPERLRERGYNQAALLARAVCDHVSLPLTEAALARVKHGASQLSRTRAQRLTALSGAFEANRRLVAGRRVLLIDDVLTTGATAVSCAGALLKAGAAEVSLLSACRA